MLLSSESVLLLLYEKMFPTSGINKKPINTQYLIDSLDKASIKCASATKPLPEQRLKTAISKERLTTPGKISKRTISRGWFKLPI